jgi:hypothetical protein
VQRAALELDESGTDMLCNGRQLSTVTGKETIVMPLRRMLAVVLFLSPAWVVAAPLPAAEPNPTLDATTLAPAALLKGDGFTVDASVPVVGYMGQFTLRGQSGNFNANGAEMLAIRIDELSAIARLGQLSKTAVFADALAASAMKTGAAVGKAVTNPVDTIAGIPAGVGRFFQSTAKSISRATESAPGSKSAQSTGDAAMDLLGVNAAKRKIAKQVDADPYTTNPVLAKQLDDLARAAFAGGVSLDVVLGVSTAGAATAISTTASISNLVWDRSPQDVRTVNEKKLATMGVGAEAVRAFVTNRWFTPTLSVPFVERLALLPGAKGRAAVVALASTVVSEGEARFMLNAVGMASRIGTEQDPVIALDLAGRILQVRTRAGRVEVPAPIDYLVWTEPVRTFAERTKGVSAQRSILITGLASERTRQGTQAAGWAIRERAK